MLGDRPTWLKVAGPPRRTAHVKARADCGRAAGHFEWVRLPWRDAKRLI